MARVLVHDLRFTDHAISALADLNIVPDDMNDMLIQGDYVVIRNRRGRAASHILIGYDAQGRVITAWPCEPSEASRIR